MSPSSHVGSAVALFLLAAALLAIGLVGMQRAEYLVAGSVRDRSKRTRVLRRGGIACLVVAVALAAAGAWFLILMFAR